MTEKRKRLTYYPFQLSLNGTIQMAFLILLTAFLSLERFGLISTSLILKQNFIEAKPNRQKIANLINKWSGYRAYLNAWKTTVNGGVARKVILLDQISKSELTWELTYENAVEKDGNDVELKIKLADAYVQGSQEPMKGIGNPEALKHDLQGYWSRRIDSEHRLVYKYIENQLIIVSCRYHY